MEEKSQLVSANFGKMTWEIMHFSPQPLQKLPTKSWMDWVIPQYILLLFLILMPLHPVWRLLQILLILLSLLLIHCRPTTKLVPKTLSLLQLLKIELIGWKSTQVPPQVTWLYVFSCTPSLLNLPKTHCSTALRSRCLTPGRIPHYPASADFLSAHCPVQCHGSQPQDFWLIHYLHKTPQVPLEPQIV